MFDDDRHLQEVISNIKESLAAGFEAAWHYANTFEVYREFYSENERQDLEALRQGQHGTLMHVTFIAFNL